jgi:hypothetical protein
MRAKHKEIRTFFVTATVYDHERTLLRCRPNGINEAEIKAWSNVDFNHFSGFCNFEARDVDGELRRYALLLVIINDNSGLRQLRLASKGIAYEGPDVPLLPADRPAFVIETENPEVEGIKLLEDLHALYRVEGVRMAAACAARQEAYELRKASLMANPPRPKDVTVHFWPRTQIDENSEMEGVQR